jgi:hypothetical protein
MAAPLQTFIQTPSDFGNLGKRQRIIARHDPFNIVPNDQVVAKLTVRKLQGLYHLGGMSPKALAQNAENGTSTGTAWFQVPTAASINARLRRIEFFWSCITEVDLLVVPRVVMQRFTFTGTASGGLIGAGKNKTTDDANVATWRSATTGMTVSLVSNAFAFQVIPPTLGVTTAVGMFYGRSKWVHEYNPVREEGFIDLVPGEGLVIYQIDAGVASDGRTYAFSARWDEYDRT